MATPSIPPSSSQPSRRRSRSANWGIPRRGMFLTLLLYVTAGLIMASFPAPAWIWNLAMGGTVLQAIALAGPKALSRSPWLRSNLWLLLSLLGSLALTVAIAIALGYVGTDNIDDIEIRSTAFQVMRMALLALFVSVLIAVFTAALGDRLLANFKRFQTSLIVAALGLLGLGLGGLLGILLAEG